MESCMNSDKNLLKICTRLDFVKTSLYFLSNLSVANLNLNFGKYFLNT